MSKLYKWSNEEARLQTILTEDGRLLVSSSNWYRSTQTDGWLQRRHDQGPTLHRLSYMLQSLMAQDVDIFVERQVLR